MLIEEAKWLGRRISTFSSTEVFPLLNVGSSTLKFRRKEQPWIERYLFGPISEKGQAIHVDAKRAPGVDLVGDLRDRHFLDKLRSVEFHSVLCSNLLEHVPNRTEVGLSLTSIIPPKGYLFVSCPRSYPYHADPIDTMFRPNVQTLASLFPSMQIVDAEIVTCGTYLDYLTIVPFKVSVGEQSKGIQDSLLRTLRTLHWHLRNLPWIFKNYQATCIVLQKL